MKRIFPFLAVSSLVALAGCSSDSGSKSPAGSNSGSNGAPASAIELTNVSYDPTRELYVQYNEAFTKHWKKQSGQDVTITQSHGGSGKQSRGVIEGSDADVVTLALAHDIDLIAEAKLLDPKWAKRLPNNSAPYTSTIVFLVRKGNPKNIKNWSDIARPGISVVTPNPKTSGGARWNYLAAWGWALRQPGGNDAKAKAFVTQIFKNVATLPDGARGATTAFVKNGQGDVLLTWENEAYLVTKKVGKGQFDIIVPPESILAEPPVAVVDANTQKRGTEKVATEYLKYLYSPEGQKIAAQNFYRPRDAAAAKVFPLPKVKLFTIDETFGGWAKTQKTHFVSGGVFDQIYKPSG